MVFCVNGYSVCPVSGRVAVSDLGRHGHGELPRSKPTGIQRHNLVVEPRKPSLVLLHQLRLERAGAIARDRDLHLARLVLTVFVVLPLWELPLC